ncbi:hypothetical protein BDN72DRAFT_957435 [Pluteus cervinus]|uniref:Uncharacterized protein n=1 Tax=Pluteus cervinus TaxID=181527 RepID=A0ACD3B329_9AGAR|nr:hypothetical protein BDN72DRAFT_957435 [Pluteus cervinus]
MDTTDNAELLQLFSSLSSSPPGAGQCTEQELLDVFIHKVEIALPLLKRRNSLSPISRLSSDVLLYIFQYVQPQLREYGFAENRNSSSPFALHAVPDQFQWVRATTHVCSQWRDLAINSPTLWTTITFPHPMWTSEVLKRSRLVPLTIVFEPRPDSDTPRNVIPSFKDTLQHQLPRARHLDITVPHKWFSDFVSPKLSLISNNLQVFICRAVAMSRANGGGLRNVRLPVTVLQNCATSLRYLALSSCTIPRQSPNTTIRLQNLSHVVLQNALSDCAESLNSISFPPTCQFSIDCMSRLDDFHLLEPFIQRFWTARRGIGRHLRVLSVAAFFRPSEMVDITARDYINSSESNLDGTRLWPDCLAFRFRIRSSIGSTALQTLWRMFPRDDVRVLSIDVDFDPDWRSLSSTFPNVQQLSLTRADLDEVFSVLADQDQNDTMVQGTNASSGLQFPNLETIALSWGHFTKERCLQFLAWLKHRKEIGRPIRKVLLYSVQGIDLRLIDEVNRYTLEEAECDSIMSDDEDLEDSEFDDVDGDM